MHSTISMFADMGVALTAILNAGDEVYPGFINRFKKLKDTKQQVADYLKKGWIWAIFFRVFDT